MLYGKRIQLNGNDIYKNPIKWYILSVICSIYFISIIVCRALDCLQGFYYLQRVKALKNKKSLGSFYIYLSMKQAWPDHIQHLT